MRFKISILIGNVEIKVVVNGMTVNAHVYNLVTLGSTLGSGILNTENENIILNKHDNVSVIVLVSSVLSESGETHITLYLEKL
jgi:hypothetical protein